MLFPEGLKTVRWDKEGTNVIERDKILIGALKHGPIDLRVRGFLIKRITPLDLEEWAEEHYNVMA